MQPLINRSRVLLVHLSFWCLYLSFFTYQVSLFVKGPEDWQRVLTVVSIQVGGAIVIGYLNYFFILPRFLAEKKVARFFLEFIVAFAIVITLRRIPPQGELSLQPAVHRSRDQFKPVHRHISQYDPFCYRVV